MVARWLDSEENPDKRPDGLVFFVVDFHCLFLRKEGGMVRVDHEAGFFFIFACSFKGSYVVSLGSSSLCAFFYLRVEKVQWIQ